MSKYKVIETRPNRPPVINKGPSRKERRKFASMNRRQKSGGLIGNWHKRIVKEMRQSKRVQKLVVSGALDWAIK